MDLRIQAALTRTPDNPVRLDKPCRRPRWFEDSTSTSVALLTERLIRPSILLHVSDPDILAEIDPPTGISVHRWEETTQRGTPKWALCPPYGEATPSTSSSEQKPQPGQVVRS